MTKKKPRSACPDAKSYKGESLPTCGTNRFLTCDACVAKWQAAQAERIKRANQGARK